MQTQPVLLSHSSLRRLKVKIPRQQLFQHLSRVQVAATAPAALPTMATRAPSILHTPHTQALMPDPSSQHTRALKLCFGGGLNLWSSLQNTRASATCLPPGTAVRPSPEPCSVPVPWALQHSLLGKVPPAPPTHVSAPWCYQTGLGSSCASKFNLVDFEG